jgi:WD40 repeat protein/tetratricopeptide (TPR) repeat protein
MQTLRIFISSPGDVADERQIAGKVIERLQGKYWSFVRLDDVFWEQKAIRSTAHYQDELANPGECEMVVGILWSRLGSLMPEKFRKASGERYQSGTEWELEMAFDAYEQSLARSGDPAAAKPDIIVYRRNQPRPRFEDPAQEALAAEQITKLDAYFRDNFWFADGTIKRPVTNYQTLDEFEEKLSRNLEELILRQIPGLKPGFEPPPISGSPFKGLQAFDFADSDRYFGRNREIREIQQRLIANAGKGLPFVLIYGGSGYGKSSLMRAGLVPVLTRPGGSLDGIQGWRRVSFQPAKGSGSLCERLARSLIQAPPPEEAEHSRQHRHWPLTGLPELADSRADSTPWDSAMLSRHFSDDDQRVFAIAAVADTLASLNRHLLLEIDQLEEMFTVPGIDAGQRAAFLRTIGDLCLSGRVWVVATMRSEFFPRVAEQPELFALVGKERGYILPPPDRQSLREIIRYPVLAARLDFERRMAEIHIAGENAKYEYLHDQILADAESSPDALPLLEFTLQQLYEEKRGTLLTWEAYAAAGGLKGAIAKRAREVYDELDPVAREARHRIFAALVHVDAARNTVTRQRAPLEGLKKSPGAEGFLQAFLGNHLLVTDEDSKTGEAIVTLAHEALLSHWDELATWIKDHRGDLLARQRLREQSQLWMQNDRRKTYLLSEARLAEAQRVAARGLFSLEPGETDFLKLSEQRSRRKTRVLKTAVAVFAAVALAAAGLGVMAKKQAKRAEIGENEATRQATKAGKLSADLEVQLKETQKQLERSRFEEGRAWLERARTAEKGGESIKAVMMAGRAVGYVGYGREAMDHEWQERTPELLGGQITADASLEMERIKQRDACDQFLSAYPVFPLPIWSSPMVANSSDRISEVCISPDGTRLAGGFGNTLKVWDLVSGKELLSLEEHTALANCLAFSPDGTQIASGAADMSIKLWDLATGKATNTLRGHDKAVKKIRYSPDGGRLLSFGDEDTDIKIWDVVSGKELMKIEGGGNPLVDAAFSPDGKLIAGTGACSDPRRKAAVMWDATSGKELVVLAESENFTSIAFSPDGRHIAAGCTDRTVRIWEISGKEWRRLTDFKEFPFVLYRPDGTLFTVSDGVLQSWQRDVPVAVLNGLDGEAVFSPDGCRLASVSKEGRAMVWNAVGVNNRAASLRNSEIILPVTPGAYSPDGKIKIHAYGKNLVISDPAIGKELRKLESSTLTPGYFGSGFEEVAFSPDGKRFASGSPDNSIRVWDTFSGSEIATLKGDKAKLTSIVFSPDGKRIVSGSHRTRVVGEIEEPGENTIRVWEAANGENISTFDALESVTCMSLSPDGKRIATGSNSSVLRIWNISGDGEVLTMRGENEEVGQGRSNTVYQVCFTQDGKVVAGAYRDESIRLWDSISGKLLLKLSLKMMPYYIEIMKADPNAFYFNPDGYYRIDITGMAFSPDGSRIACHANDGAVRIWDTKTGDLLDTVTPYRMRGNDIEFGEDGGMLRIDGLHGIRFLNAAHSAEAVESDVSAVRIDLLHFHRQGLLSLDETEVRWGDENLNPQGAGFSPQHTQRDELAVLAKAGVTPGQEALLRLGILVQGEQWRAAVAWWKSLDFAGIDTVSKVELQRTYLVMLLRRALALVNEDPLDDMRVILPELVATLTEEILMDVRVSLALTGFLSEYRTVEPERLEMVASLRSVLVSEFQKRGLDVEVLDPAAQVREAALDFSNRGDSFFKDGKVPEAAKAYGKSLAIFRKLASDDPNNSLRWRDVAIALYRVGDACADMERKTEATRAFEESSAIMRYLSKTAPDSKEARLDYVFSLGKYGDSLAAQEKYAEAETAFDEMLAIYKKIAEEAGYSTERQLDLVMAYYKVGEIAKKAGKTEAARANWTKVHEILGKLNLEGRLSEDQKGLIPTIKLELEKLDE